MLSYSSRLFSLQSPSWLTWLVDSHKFNIDHFSYHAHDSCGHNQLSLSSDTARYDSHYWIALQVVSYSWPLGEKRWAFCGNLKNYNTGFGSWIINYWGSVSHLVLIVVVSKFPATNWKIIYRSMFLICCTTPTIVINCENQPSKEIHITQDIEKEIDGKIIQTPSNCELVSTYAWFIYIHSLWKSVVPPLVLILWPPWFSMHYLYLVCDVIFLDWNMHVYDAFHVNPEDYRKSAFCFGFEKCIGLSDFGLGSWMFIVVIFGFFEYVHCLLNSLG